MSIPSGLFDAFRTNGAPTYYGPNQTPVTADVLEAGLIFAFVILAISFFCVLPGIRGREVCHLKSISNEKKKLVLYSNHNFVRLLFQYF